MPGDTWRTLTNADKYELLSLEPYQLGRRTDNDGILGRTTIIDPATQARLNYALAAGVRESDGTAAACFNPRHEIRITQRGVTTEIIICFECRQVQVQRGGKVIAYFLTSESPQQTFDEVLLKAGVPLASKGQR